MGQSGARGGEGRAASGGAEVGGADGAREPRMRLLRQARGGKLLAASGVAAQHVGRARRAGVRRRSARSEGEACRDAAAAP